MTEDTPPTITSEPGNYAVIPHWLISAVKPTAVVVYLALRTWADNSTGHAFPKIDAIAERAGVSVNTATAGIKSLEEVGALKRVARYRPDGSRTSNSYHLSSHTSLPDIQNSGGTPPKKEGIQDPPKSGGSHTPRNGVAELDSIELDPRELEKTPHTPHTKTQETAPPATRAASDDFTRFWSIAVKKTGKGAARTAFKKATTDMQTLAPAWVAANKAWATWADKTKIPHPTTWLNQERWDDDPPTPELRAVGKMAGVHDLMKTMEQEEQAKNEQRRNIETTSTRRTIRPDDDASGNQRPALESRSMGRSAG